LQLGINIIRVREKGLVKITDFDILLKEDKISKNTIDTLLKQIIFLSALKANSHINSYLSKSTFANEDLFKSLLNKEVPFERSVASRSNLINMWDFEKNQLILPQNIAIHSRILVWWKCPKGHSFEQIIANRVKVKGCPFCLGRRACHDNCLATVNPSLAKEWHSRKNSNLTPFDVLPGSGKKVWWLCSKGHEYELVIGVRNRLSRGCPYCSGQRGRFK